MPTVTAHAPTPVPLRPDDWVPAGPFRAHVRLLLAERHWTPELLALAAGVPVRTVRRLALRPPRRGERVRRVDATRLLALQPATLRRLRAQRVDATSSRGIVQRLLYRGWTVPRIADEAGLTHASVQRLLGGQETCPLLTDLAIRALRAAMLDTDPGEPLLGSLRRAAA